MKREKVYLSGPISSIGYEEACRRFGDAEKYLQKLGYRTSNPTKMTLCVWLALHGYYSLCLWIQLLWLSATCQCIYLLDGWHTSDGARAERAVARVMGITALYEQTKRKPLGNLPAPTHVLTPEKKTVKNIKKNKAI